MRRRFLIKRKTVLLCSVPFLLVGGVTLAKWVESERHFFLREMHGLIEKSVSYVLGAEVTFGTVRLGAFHEAFLEDVSIRFPGREALLTFGQAHFRRGKKRMALTFKEGVLRWGGMTLNRMTGRLEFLEGGGGNPAFSLEKAVAEGSFLGGEVEGVFAKKGALAYEGKITLKDLLWNRRRLSGRGEEVVLLRESRNGHDFEIKSVWRQLSMDAVPFDNVTGRLSRRGDRLSIEKIRWGKILSLSGEMTLSSPYETRGVMHFKTGSEDLRPLLGDPPGTLPRFVEGRLFFSGPFKKMHLRGQMVAKEGRIKEIDYARLTSLFQGHFPLVTVESRIERMSPPGSILTVMGLVDLGAVGEKGFYRTLALSGEGALVWRGMTFQYPSAETLVFGKENGAATVHFKTFVNQAPAAEEEEFELEYQFRDDKKMRIRLKGEEEFLGLERQWRF